MKLIWATGTHVGRVRESNQDTVIPKVSGASTEGLVVLVADGMGGAVGGDIASMVAATAAEAANGTPEDRVTAANSAVVAEVASHPELAGMGTTMTLVDIDAEGIADFAHVGDSRAYLYRHGILRQLSQDHSVVAEHLRAGTITEDEAETHPHRGILTRVLGLGEQLKVDTFQERLQPQDRLMLCSDGLSGMMDDDQIQEILGRETAEEAVWALIEGANLAGGHDNVTVAVIDIEQ